MHPHPGGRQRINRIAGIASSGEGENPVDHLFDGNPRRVDDDSVRRGAQWRHGPGGVAPIPFVDLLRKAGETNSKPLSFNCL